jgi:CheY-like chemotaxis protein
MMRVSEERFLMPSIRVLLSHPDLGVLSACQERLANGGFAVAAAPSGLECLARLRSFTPDVLVLDMDLPWGGGEGVLARLGEDRDLPRVPVVILSSRSAHFAVDIPGVPVTGRLTGQLTAPLVERLILDHIPLCYRGRGHGQAAG